MPSPSKSSPIPHETRSIEPKTALVAPATHSAPTAESISSTESTSSTKSIPTTKSIPPTKSIPIVRWFDSWAGSGRERDDDRRVDWARCIPFFALHASVVALPFVGFSWFALGFAVALYLVRMFAITAFYHRYFAHRAFDTSRPMQFVFAALGASAVQRGPLWWAAHHRIHHRTSDEPGDPHSPTQSGFWWSHCGWITTRGAFRTRVEQVKDLARFPELVFLDRFDILVPVLGGAATFGLGALLSRFAPSLGVDGLQLLLWGIASTIVLYHATFSINSLAHVFGRRVYPTSDTSRNSMLLALLTLGEGWHNNHHHYQGSARQGFRWWQIDVSYYGLCALAALGLVSNLRPVPQRIVASARRLPIPPR